MKEFYEALILYVCDADLRTVDNLTENVAADYTLDEITGIRWLEQAEEPNHERNPEETR